MAIVIISSKANWNVWKLQASKLERIIHTRTKPTHPTNRDYLCKTDMLKEINKNRLLYGFIKFSLWDKGSMTNHIFRLYFNKISPHTIRKPPPPVHNSPLVLMIHNDFFLNSETKCHYIQWNLTFPSRRFKVNIPIFPELPNLVFFLCFITEQNMPSASWLSKMYICDMYHKYFFQTHPVAINKI